MNKLVRLPSLAERAAQGERRAVIGLRHEQAAISALRAMRAGSPSWYYGFRPATQDEDDAGIDLFAEIDLGDVPVQVKSSREGLFRHCHRYSGMQVAYLVVTDQLCPDQIRQQFLLEIGEMRTRFFREARR